MTFLAEIGLPGDPLFQVGVDATTLAIVGLKVIVIFVVLLVATMFAVWFERKVIADMQNRIGPNRAGPFGVFQTLADGMKLMFKEDLIPKGADRFVFKLAPVLAVVPAFLTLAVIPLGHVVEIFGRQTRLQLADPPLGVLWILMMSGISIYGVMLAGWSSGSKYPLLGSVRASAQMISYEAALGIAIAAVVLATGGLEVSRIVSEQLGGVGSSIPSWVPGWNIFKLAFVPFFIFIVAIVAEMNRPPFDLVEAEQELVGGFNTEYSSLRFAMFFLAEFMATVTMSAVTATLFLGGGDGPTFGMPESLMYLFWLLFKIVLLMYCLVWLRGTLPRFRYDQLMSLGWKVLIPVGSLWLIIVASSQIGTKPFIIAASVGGIGLILLFLAQMNSENDTPEQDSEIHSEQLSENIEGRQNGLL